MAYVPVPKDLTKVNTKVFVQLNQGGSLSIRDKELLYVIRRILKAPILMPDGHTEHPAKGAAGRHYFPTAGKCGSK